LCNIVVLFSTVLLPSLDNEKQCSLQMINNIVECQILISILLIDQYLIFHNIWYSYIYSLKLTRIYALRFLSRLVKNADYSLFNEVWEEDANASGGKRRLFYMF